MGRQLCQVDSCKEERDEPPMGRVVMKEGFGEEAISQLGLTGDWEFCALLGGKGAPCTKV